MHLNCSFESREGIGLYMVVHPAIAIVSGLIHKRVWIVESSFIVDPTGGIRTDIAQRTRKLGLGYAHV